MKSREIHMDVTVINSCGNDETWDWYSLDELESDYKDADILDLPNDSDKIMEVRIDEQRINVETFGNFIQYMIDKYGLKVERNQK